MSTDLPFLGGCYGYSNSAISSYRHASHVSPGQTYKAQMASIQKTIGSHLHQSSASVSPQQAPQAATRSVSLSVPSAYVPPPTINLQPYHAQGPTSQASASSPSKSASLTLSSSKALESSSKLATPQFFPLKRVDFEIISENSVGGGSMGLPRPYGTFTAIRGGDGLAVFERLPPQKPSRGASHEPPPPPSPSPSIPFDSLHNDAQQLAELPSEPVASEGGLQSVEIPAFKSKSGLLLPMASRLKSSGLPENIRIDCGYGLSKSFMSNRPGVALSPVKPSTSQLQAKKDKKVESGAHTWALTSMSEVEEEEKRMDSLMEETVEILTAISVGGAREGKGVDSTLTARSRASALPPEHTLPRRNTRVGR